MDGFGFLGRQATRADDSADLLDRECDHLLRRVGLGKQGRRHLIHALIGTLRAQQYRDQQRVRVAVIEGHECLWIERLQSLIDEGDALRFI